MEGSLFEVPIGKGHHTLGSVLGPCIYEIPQIGRSLLPEPYMHHTDNGWFGLYRRPLQKQVSSAESARLSVLIYLVDIRPNPDPSTYCVT